MNVDIIIPTFNNAKFLEEALFSCFLQTYSNFKIIVIDDCSTQDIKRVVNSFNSKKIKLIRNERNLGPAASRNVGINNSCGEIISLLDSDDIWTKYKLERSIEVFKKNPEIGMVCGNYRRLEDRKNICKKFYQKDIVVNFETLKRVNWVASGSVSFRRSILKKTGLFDEKYWVGEDYDMWIRMSKNTKIKYISDVLYYYSVDSNQKSLTSDESLFDHHKKVLLEIKSKYY